ncbi:NAD(P)H-hydrate dehydratase [Flavobacterium cerinum]|uniref:ADP-dependent (S)-NAD(P)H-hydrate dehydratase n=1 Tax=Flavobacterium cerinum TaxID=2502784 RepID=A0ABY5INS4_9FLAO|nr:NAD(P)H-hydrate dehydratase [Flavobacterium cerinum]UUC44394.1 NAD(P)H-hydrate dehydratase [Flavobacterium cerinum]
MDNLIKIDKKTVLERFHPIDKYTHKGIQGHALIVGGSYGKIGAPLLSAKACLKSGAGLVTAYIPQCGYDILQTGIPEVMVETDDYPTHITAITTEANIRAVGLGIGMGQHQETQQAVFHFLKLNTLPLVLDADGINIMSENKEWLEFLPAQTIVTPHRKELERLIGLWDDEADKMKKVISFSETYDLVVVLKGAPTRIVYKNNVFENTTGNQSLATAGSGDVLTGIITGLLAQSYDPDAAAIVGVYIHGLTADLALPELGYHAFVASDIIANLGKAFSTLYE